MNKNDVYMRKKDVYDILRQCTLIIDCVDEPQMPDMVAKRISFLVNNIRSIIFCECEVFND